MGLKNFLIYSLVLLTGLKLTISEFAGNANYEEPEVCRGSSEVVSTSGANDLARYIKLKKRYQNCTYVDGNLEIKFLEQGNETFDLSFLSKIEEVSGYVLITSVVAETIPLTSLKIIRGNQLFNYNNHSYSLFVGVNNNETRGLKELLLTNLSEITRGDVVFVNNDLLCYHDTILWRDIKFNPEYKVRFTSTNSSKTASQLCPPCAPECFKNETKNYHCWGSGPNKCQKLIREICHKSCETGCFGYAISECCHSQCAGGCTGPRSSDCVACKNFYNEGTCVSECPKLRKYNRNTMVLEDNPYGKYAFKSLCLKKCPDYILVDEQNALCVRKCSENYYPVNNTCVPCDGACPKWCSGLKQDEFLSSRNIDQFKNCTVIDGNLKIIQTTFDGDSYTNLEGLKREQLNVFKTVREITGYLMVQGGNQAMSDLSFLSNLQVIHGRDLDIASNAFSAFMTNLNSLELISLRSIKNGKVSLFGNKALCFIEGTDFTQLLTVQKNQDPGFKIKDYVQSRDNRPPEDCKRDGDVCHQSCSDEGCWGKGANKCLNCRSFKIDNSSNICIEDCTRAPMLYNAGNKLCKFCDEECLDSCYGEGPGNCTLCKHVTIRGQDNSTTCLNQCSEMFFAKENNICLPCSDKCAEGCTGPSDIVGIGGCNTCDLAIETKDELNKTIFRCLSDGTYRCPYNYYVTYISKETSIHLLGSEILMGSSACFHCDEMCEECFQGGNVNCIKCKYVKQDSACRLSCLNMFYPDENKDCQQCHEECQGGCYGPSKTQCNACNNFKVYLDKASWTDNHNNCTDPGVSCRQFNCTKTCPSDMTYTIKDPLSDGETTTLCVDESHPEVAARLAQQEDDNKKKTSIILGSVIGGVLLLAAALVLFGYCWCQRAKAQGKTAILTAKMTGYEDEVEPPVHF